MDGATVDRYLRRIGYSGVREPTLVNLQHLMTAHLQSVPFENLDVHCGRPILVGDLSILVKKVIDGNGGGYCFELNHLFCELLVALGYVATPHLSRVRWETPEDLVLGFTHMMLLVQLSGKTWLVDVGTSIGCPAPLDVHCADHTRTPYSTHRVQPTNDNIHEFEQQLLDSHGVWKSCYRFSTAFRSFPSDWVIASYFVSTHSFSFMVAKLLVAIYTASGERLVLYDNELIRRGPSGVVERRVVSDPHELRRLLCEDFRVPVDRLRGLVMPGVGPPWPMEGPDVVLSPSS